MDILVRAFANLNGLGTALRRDKRLRDKDELRSFATGFSSRQAFFEFVDIGLGKERADLKVRGNIPFDCYYRVLLPDLYILILVLFVTVQLPPPTISIESSRVYDCENEKGTEGWVAYLLEGCDFGTIMSLGVHKAARICSLANGQDDRVTTSLFIQRMHA
jgi:hypothetical protein